MEFFVFIILREVCCRRPDSHTGTVERDVSDGAEISSEAGRGHLVLRLDASRESPWWTIFRYTPTDIQTKAVLPIQNWNDFINFEECDPRCIYSMKSSKP